MIFSYCFKEHRIRVEHLSRRSAHVIIRLWVIRQILWPWPTFGSHSSWMSRRKDLAWPRVSNKPWPRPLLPLRSILWVVYARCRPAWVLHQLYAAALFWRFGRGDPRPIPIVFREKPVADDAPLCIVRSSRCEIVLFG